MTGAPLVALTTYHPNEDDRVNLPAAYHRAVRRAGGRALLVPPGEPDVDGLLDLVDAVVLTGGGDLDPALNRDRSHAAVYGVSRERDDAELALARRAVERRTPTLAICRGMQVVNVALGGSLHPHLPDVVGPDVIHRDDPPGAVPHDVTVEPGCLIASVMQATRVSTASWHHQGVDELGDGLRPVAWAPDGVVEAVELEGHPFLEAVQWHPELTAATDPHQQRLFDALVHHSR